MKTGFFKFTGVIGLALILASIAACEDPSFQAVKSGDLSAIKESLKEGVNIDKLDDNGRTLLWHACSLGNMDAVKLLLEAGADPNVDNSNVGPPLHAAARKGYLDVIKMLHDAGSDLEVVDKYGETMLSEAIRGKHLNVLQYALAHGVKAAHRSKAGMAIHFASSANLPEFVEALVIAGSPVDTRNWSGKTPLHCAMFRDGELVAKILLDNGADPRAVDDRGKTALDIAIKFEATRCTQLLQDAIALQESRTDGNR